MVSSFDLTKLKKLLQDFYNITKIRITVFNNTFEELIAYPEERALFCRILRKNPVAKKACILSDEKACKTAASRKSTYIYRCHAGLTEAITPIYLGNIPIGYLFFGHVFSYPDHETGFQQIQTYCHNYDVDTNQLKNACYKQPITTDDYIHSAAHILQAVTAYLCMERMVGLKQKDLPVQIDEYINTYFDQDISVQSICKYFKIGKTYLYEIGKQNYGIGIAEHIRNLRIKKATSLLTAQPELRISDVAGLCGFQDYNYFITAFKRVIGVPPAKYRDLKHNPSIKL